MTYLRKNKGAVLVLVLGAVALLSVLAIELAHRANVEVSQTARSSRDGQMSEDGWLDGKEGGTGANRDLSSANPDQGDGK